MTVAVVGLGYVGLSLSVLLSKKFTVHAVDIDDRKVAMLAKLQSPILDPDISHHLANNSLKLSPTTDFDSAVKNARFVVVATPTDYDPESHRFDVSSVRAVTKKALEINPEANVILNPPSLLVWWMNCVKNLDQTASTSLRVSERRACPL